jgi:hypothetical protein
MGYIKKLKNNELVGGTDKTTIYPVTSTEAVFEEVSDEEFKSQKYLNNHITNERIVDNTIENQKLKDDTIDMGKLNTQLKTIIQNAYDASWKVKEEPFSLETKYDANDVVYDPDTNSSYVSLTADNQGNPVRLEDEEEVNPYWRLVINGISAVQATEEIEATKDELIDYIQENLKDQVDGEIADAESRVAAAEQYAQGVIAEAEQTARSISGIVYQTVAATPNYTDTIPVQNKAVTAQIGYYTCSGGSGATIIVDDTDAEAFTPVKGGHIKILMTQKSAVTSGNVQLQFGSVTATKKVLLYNGETVSSSNTWDEGDVISVYYDGTYYQASNAQGGGGKAEKIKYDNSQSGLSADNVQRALDEIKKNIGDVDYDETVIPLTVIANSRYIISNGVVGIDDAYDFFKRAEPIDVSSYDKISATFYLKDAYTSVSVFTDDNGNVVGNKILNDGQEYVSFNIPDGATKLYLCTRKNESTGVYDPFGAKITEGISVMGRIDKIDDYLYGDLRTLAVGQTYKENESVQTTDKQLLKMPRPVIEMNLTDEIVAGDLRVYSGGTYKASKNVKVYTGNDSEYNEGDYALGSYAEYTITVTAGNSAGNIIVNNESIEITDGETAAEIADSIVENIIIDGWTLSSEDDTVTVKCRTIGSNTTSITFDDGDTGVTLSGISTPSSTGTDVLRVYASGSWNNAVLSDYAASSVWGEGVLTLAQFQEEAVQDHVPKLYDSLGQNSDGAINQAAVTKLLTKGADSYSETKDVSDFHIYNGHNSNSGTWDTSYGKFIVVPTVGLDSVYLGTPPTNQSLYWILLKSFTEPVSGGTIDFCDGFSGYQTTGAPVSATVSIPDDCNYLIVYRYLGASNQYNVTPSSIILNFKAIVGMSGIEGSISTDTTKIGEIPIYAAENGSIYNNSTNIQICSKFIPVKPLTKYRFSSSRNNTLCILTSDSYTAGQSISNFATGESIRTISAGGNLELTTPSNAAYALFRTTAADGTPITISVTEILDVSTALALCESQISEANDDIERILYRDAANIRYSDFYDSSLSDNEVWDNILSATSFIPKKNIVIDRNMAISRVLYVGSNTTIYIDNVTIKQADDVFDNVFRGINEIPTTSEGYDIVAGEDLELLENIKIIGIGNARIEGPDYTSKIGTDKNGTRTSQVSFDRVKGLEIGNIAYSKTRGWCHCFMFVEDAYIHDILFDNLEDGANRDGFDFRSGCHNIVVENVGGRTGDDLFAFHAHNVASLNGTREGYPRRYFCIQYIDKLNNENRLSELDVHDCRINNSYKYNGYWHVGICLAGHGTYTYNISITNIKAGGHITSGQDYIQGLITLYKFGNYVNDHMHDILVSNIINDSDSNMPVFNNDCKVYNVWVNKLVNNTTNKTADIQYGEGVTLLNTGNYHRISGTFTQSGAALVNKDIIFTSEGVNYTAKTNSNGYNTFLPAGTYTVTCSGYTLSISSVTIGSSDVVQNISAT